MNSAPKIENYEKYRTEPPAGAVGLKTGPPLPGAEALDPFGVQRAPEERGPAPSRREIKRKEENEKKLKHSFSNMKD